MNRAPRPHQLQIIKDETQTGEARRLAAHLSSDADLSENVRGKIAIIVVELSRNLIKYGGGGQILMRELEGEGFEIIALDKGPGMDLSITMEDGFSTTGTPGTGLGAVRRQADELDIYTAPKQGTAILARVWTHGKPQERSALEYGAVCIPIQGERECGDLWSVKEFGGRFVLSVVDGLGHGELAAEAAEEAMRIFHLYCSEMPCSILERVHLALKKTRGAAMAIAELPNGTSKLRYGGIGNISTVLLAEEKSQTLVSHNGTLGAQIRRCQEFEYQVAKDSIIVMFSDGLVSNWDIKKYRGLTQKDPTLIAAVIYRDYTRGRDDVTVLVAREPIA